MPAHRHWLPRREGSVQSDTALRQGVAVSTYETACHFSPAYLGSLLQVGRRCRLDAHVDRSRQGRMGSCCMPGNLQCVHMRAANTRLGAKEQASALPAGA